MTKKKSANNLFGSLIFVSSVALIIFVVFGFFFTKTFRRVKVNKLPQKKTVQLTAPELPPGYDWQLVDEDQKVINKILWRTNDLTKFGYITLPGREWETKLLLNSEEELLDTDVFATYYASSSSLEKNGWHNAHTGFSVRDGWVGLKQGSIALMAMQYNPETPGDSFFKEANGKMLVVNLYEHSPRDSVITSPGGGVYRYPHTRKYRIFISEILPVDEVISSRTEVKSWSEMTQQFYSKMYTPSED